MNIIKVENLSKKYFIRHDKKAMDAYRYKSLSESLTHVTRAIYQRIRHPLSPNKENTDIEEFYALKDINFEIEQGDRIGIIGSNGAGKSTLLKLLSRITDPSTGKIIIEGRVASLLEVGTGFHPELTGRENIYLNGAILGMTRQEVRCKFDEIVDFAGVEQFLDTPVKRFSSGMHVRLAFAVAAHLEPEILVVDEVLAVGDASFQKKCINKMNTVAKEGRTILFVSHQMQAVTNLCNKAILLDNGKITHEGGTNEVISRYLNEKSTAKVLVLKERKDRKGNGKLTLLDTWLEDENNNRVTNVILGQTVNICLRYKIKNNEAIKGLTVAFAINSLQNIQISDLSNRSTGEEFLTPLQPVGIIKCVIKKLPLNIGTYIYNIMTREHNGDILDYVVDAGRFTVTEGDYFGTGKIPTSDRLIMMEHNWNISSENISNT
jgi:lipopolysaccharide transport system ATP-binding protein